MCQARVATVCEASAGLGLGLWPRIKRSQGAAQGDNGVAGLRADDDGRGRKCRGVTRERVCILERQWCTGWTHLKQRGGVQVGAEGHKRIDEWCIKQFQNWVSLCSLAHGMLSWHHNGEVAGDEIMQTQIV
jgi:hypothetical protein